MVFQLKMILFIILSTFLCREEQPAVSRPSHPTAAGVGDYDHRVGRRRHDDACSLQPNRDKSEEFFGVKPDIFAMNIHPMDLRPPPAGQTGPCAGRTEPGGANADHP